MPVEALPVADRLKALKTASELAGACGKSRFLITNMHNDGRLPYVMVGRVRMSTLDQLWEAFEQEADADREARGITPRTSKCANLRSKTDRAARVASARKALGCKAEG